MGYSVEAAFIKPNIDERDFASFINAFTTSTHFFRKQLPIGDARRDDKAAIYIGNYNDVTIFFYEGMFNGKRTEIGFAPAEQMIIDLNKDKSILFITNEESACGYYFHIIEKGITIRRKEGYDEGLTIDIGEELPLEKECYYEKIVNDDGDTIYKVWWERGQRYNESTHYSIGGDMAFNLCKEFVGYRFENIPNEIIMHQYLDDDILTAK